MATDLNRDYIVKGYELYRSLRQHEWTFDDGSGEFRAAKLAFPLEVTDHLLRRGMPHEPEPEPAVRVTVEQLARALEGFWLETTSNGAIYHGHVTDPDHVALVLHAALSSQHAHREDGGVVAAHVCCEHADGTRVTVEQLATWFREHGIAIGRGDYPHACATHPEALAECILEDITGKAHPMPEKAGHPRWPMTREHLFTRLAYALEQTGILTAREWEPGGERVYVKALNPDGLACELLNHIDGQEADAPAAAARLAREAAPERPDTVTVNERDLRIAMDGQPVTVRLSGMKYVGYLAAADDTASTLFGRLRRTVFAPSVPGHGALEALERCRSALLLLQPHDRVNAVRTLHGEFVPLSIHGPMGADGDEPEKAGSCPFHMGHGELGECNCDLKKYACWPMGYDELKARLQRVLTGRQIDVDKVFEDAARTAGGALEPYIVGTPRYPAGLAANLADEIEDQGDRDCAVPDGYTCAVCGQPASEHTVTRPAASLPEPDGAERAGAVPDPDPDLTAIARIRGHLAALSGTSGAGQAHAIDVLRYVAACWGYDLADRDDDF